MKLPLLLTAAAFALASTTTHAATITWSAPTGISGDADVRANGSLVGAFNIDGPSAPATTINGVPFAPFTFSGNMATVGDFTFTSPVPFASSFFGLTGPNPFGSLSPQYRALLGTYGRNLSEAFTLTMNNLTVGDTYEFQWWANTSVTVGGLVTATAGNFVVLDSNPSGSAGGVGQYAVGSFVANATSQAITFSGPGTNVLINGFQLRNSTPVVPEPTTALFGLAVCCVAATRRRR